jgi:hypothetical protein
MAHNSVEAEPATEQPPVPDRLEYETEWSTTAPDNVKITVELWATRSRREGEVRILDGLSLGTIADRDAAEATLDPAPAAVRRWGLEWVEGQLQYGQGIMASRRNQSHR